MKFLSLILTFVSVAVKAQQIIKITSHPQEVLELVKKYLPANPSILEAGAFDGADTKRMSITWPKGKIYSFEPVPEIFLAAQKNVSNLKNVKLFNLALSDKNGIIKFYVSEFASHPGAVSASSSIYQPLDHLKYEPAISFRKSIQVKSKTLDHWAQENKIQRIDFCWLDMQGAELNMLKHGLKMLQNIKIIYTEVIFVEAYKNQPLYKDVKKWLLKQGFELLALDFDELHAEKGHKIKIGEPYHGNAIFINKKLS